MVLITVGGPPGSGTSTVCKLLQDKLGLEYVYAGQIFRDMASENGLSLEDFSRKCEGEPEIDIELDRRMTYRARSGDVILEGRMIGPLCKRDDIESVRVYLDADPAIRASRVMERDGGELEKVIQMMSDREGSERIRYLNYYGIDPTDKKWYDLVIDSGAITPGKEVEIILDYCSNDK